MLFILLSLCWVFLLATTLIAVLSLGIVVLDDLFPHIFRLSVTSANRFYRWGSYSLIAAIVLTVFSVIVILRLLIGGGTSAL
jgi:hypothetical protein